MYTEGKGIEDMSSWRISCASGSCNDQPFETWHLSLAYEFLTSMYLMSYHSAP